MRIAAPNAHAASLVLMVACLALGQAACEIERYVYYGPDTADASPSDTAVPDGTTLPDGGPLPQDVGDPPDDGRVDVPLIDVSPPLDGGPDTIFDPPEVGPDVPDVSFEEAPVLYELNPNVGSTLGGDQVFLEGIRFTFQTEVRIAGILQTEIDVIDSRQLVLFTTPLPEGTWDVKVTTAAGTASIEDAFTAVAPLQISTIEPAIGQVVGGETVTVRGAGFTDATRIAFGPREATILERVNPTLLRIVTPPGARLGQVDVVAWDARVARAPAAFTYTARPRLLGVVPSVGPAGGGIRLRLDGEGIDAACTARVGGRATPVLETEAGWPAIDLPAGMPGAADVVVDCGARGADVLGDGFLYLERDALTVSAVWPSVGFARGGEIISVLGSGLQNASAVTLGGTAATILRTSPWSIDVLTPARAPGSVDVRVSLPGGDELLADGFSYVDLPVFVRLAPASGAPDAAQAATLSGAGLAAVSRLEVDGRAIVPTAQDERSISFAVPAGAPGPARIWARIGALRLDTGLSYERLTPLRFEGFFPATGATAGGSVVYVSGDGFTNGCSVYLDGVPAVTTVVAPGLLAASVPPHAAGAVSLEVNGCGTDWLAPARYQYVDPRRPPGGVGGDVLDGELRVTVIEQGTNARIAGASVAVRVRDTTPHAGLTNAMGQIVFLGDDLRGPQTVTAFAPDRSAETYVDITRNQVTIVLAALPPEPCPDPLDPACQPPPQPPPGEIIGFLTGLQKVFDPPPGARLYAVLDTTRLSPGYVNPDPGPMARLTNDGPFRITTRLGDMALVALCGYQFEQTGQFVPLTMGVVRNLQQRPGGPPIRTTIDCDIPLDQQITIKLTNAPPLVAPGSGLAFPGRYQGRLVFDFGGEGIFESLPTVAGTASIFTGGAFPRLEGPLDGVFFDLTAGVYPLAGNIPAAEAYLRRGVRFDRVYTMPGLMAVPQLVHPSVSEPFIRERYVEWSIDERFGRPDFYYISATSSGPGFPRWTVWLPGDRRSFSFADFPDFVETIGDLPGPGEPAISLSLLVRAVDADAFSYDSFDRYILRLSAWNASSVAYEFVQLQPPPP